MLSIFFAKRECSHNNFNRVAFFWFNFFIIRRWIFFIILEETRFNLVCVLFYQIFRILILVLIHSHKLIIILFFWLRDNSDISIDFIRYNWEIFLTYGSCSGRPVWTLRVRLFSFIFWIAKIFFKKILDLGQVFRNKTRSVLMLFDFFMNHFF